MLVLHCRTRYSTSNSLTGAGWNCKKLMINSRRFLGLRRMMRNWRLYRWYRWRLNRGERRSSLVGCCRKSRNIDCLLQEEKEHVLEQLEDVSDFYGTLSLKRWQYRTVGLKWVVSQHQLSHNPCWCEVSQPAED